MDIDYDKKDIKESPKVKKVEKKNYQRVGVTTLNVVHIAL